jgi:L-fuculose-phosphate aldolase
MDPGARDWPLATFSGKFRQIELILVPFFFRKIKPASMIGLPSPELIHCGGRRFSREAVPYPLKSDPEHERNPQWLETFTPKLETTTMSSDWQFRRDLTRISKMVYQRGLVAGTDGNISARVHGDRILISPSGSCLGMLEPGDFVLIDFAGNLIAGRGKPSSERWMHIAAYQERPDIMAAIHAHPPATIAFTVAGLAMDQCALPEVILAFGQVPITAYATPATTEGALVVRDLIRRFDALVLDRHGSITVGKTPADAFFKLEKLEHGAHVMLLAHGMGAARSLPPAEIAKLAALREQMGIGKATDVSGTCIPPGTAPASLRIAKGETY